MEKIRCQRWREILHRVAAEYCQLPAPEKKWIAVRLDKIALLQRQLDHLFNAGNGATACRLCQENCCDKGHNHMTLVNLLSYIQQNILPPSADFTKTCPFLSDQGCLLVVESRPYNCISFICDTIEDVLNDEERRHFYALDQQLRQLYQEFSGRYLGAAMTGLLLQEPRLSERSFFALK